MAPKVSIKLAISVRGSLARARWLMAFGEYNLRWIDCQYSVSAEGVAEVEPSMLHSPNAALVLTFAGSRPAVLSRDRPVVPGVAQLLGHKGSDFANHLDLFREHGGGPSPNAEWLDLLGMQYLYYRLGERRDGYDDLLYRLYLATSQDDPQADNPLSAALFSRGGVSRMDGRRRPDYSRSLAALPDNFLGHLVGDPRTWAFVESSHGDLQGEEGFREVEAPKGLKLPRLLSLLEKKGDGFVWTYLIRGESPEDPCFVGYVAFPAPVLAALSGSSRWNTLRNDGDCSRTLEGLIAAQ